MNLNQVQGMAGGAGRAISIFPVDWKSGRGISLPKELKPDQIKQFVSIAESVLDGVRDLHHHLPADAAKQAQAMAALGVRGMVHHVPWLLRVAVAQLADLQASLGVVASGQRPIIQALINGGEQGKQIMANSLSCSGLGLVRGISWVSGHLTVIYTVTTPECPAKGAVATAFGEAATDLKTRLNAAGFTVTTEEAKLVDGVWDPSDASETYRDLVKKAHQTLPACAAVRVPRF